jgi:hypothetical protein
MSRYLILAAVGVLALALASPASAHGPGRSFAGQHSPMYKSGQSSYFPISHSNLSQYGTKFSHGYYFGRNNFYWNRQCWSNRYRCNCYWNPYACCWYYWYAPGSCYYPLSYITIAPPTVVVNSPGTAVVTPGATMPPAGPPMP